jgi:TolB-like protein/DNA-binding winged helix-turn-helix (wHTH) protein
MDEFHRARESVVRFGVFEADLRAGELRKRGVKVKLQEQPFQILQILLEHVGEVVTREQVRQKIWPAETFVDFDHGLNNAIRRLREALGDTADTPRFIETLPKRGYRFIFPVNGNGVGNVVPSAEAQLLPEVEVASRRWHLPRTTALLIASATTFLVLAIALGSIFGNPRRWVSAGSSSPSIHSLAVLPLQNLSGDPAQEYFVDALTEELITELSRISALRVISRTSVMRYKKTDKSLPEIASELSVDRIVEGSVLRSGDRVRITVQLIYAPRDMNLWAQTYDRDLRDVLTLQGTVASAIADEIRIKMTPSEKAQVRASRSVNFQALDDYLKGNEHLDRSGPFEFMNGKQKRYLEEKRAAQNFFQRSISVDPYYAPAYVGLARSLRWDPVSQDRTESARAALLQAIALDENLANAHLEMAELLYHADWNWSAADKEFKRAIELNPSFALAHAQYADYLDAMRRFDESTSEDQLVLILDPGHWGVQNSYFRRRQYDRAIELIQLCTKGDHSDVTCHSDLAFTYQAAGMYEQAVHEWEEVIRMLDYQDTADAMERALVRHGYRAAYREWARGLERLRNEGVFVPTRFVAFTNALSGDNDRAFLWLERSYRLRDGYLTDLTSDPIWDPLRSDPRFKDLVARIGLPQ